MERNETFHTTIASGGVQDDIDRIETQGEAAGMVCSGQGLQKQWDKRPAVVQRKRDHDHNILSLGAGAAGSCQYDSGITNGRLCGTAETETGVTKRFGMFRNTAYWQRQHYVPSGAERGIAENHR